MQEKRAPWKVDDSVEWIYKRQEGDIHVYAHSKEEAVATIVAHGFCNVDVEKIVQGTSKLTDHLKRSEIK